MASAALLRPARRLPVRRARDQPRGRGRRRLRRPARCSASTSAARRRAWRCRRTAARSTSATSWTARVSVFDLDAAADAGRWPTCRCVATLPAVGDREAERHGAARQAALLRRARHAPGARPLHELRVLPQRRRPRRPRVGPHRLRRGPAQHDQPARPRRPARASCTGATTSTRCRTSRARSATLAGGTGPDDRRRSSTPARAASRSATPRPASARTSMRWRPTSPRSTPSRRARCANADGSADRGRRRRQARCFSAKNCAQLPRRHGVHGERRATIRRTSARIKATSGNRLGGALTGIDVPTLRDVWATAPYLHDGSAATLGDAVRAHNNVDRRPTRTSPTSSPTSADRQPGRRRGAPRRRAPARGSRPVLQQHDACGQHGPASAPRPSTSAGAPPRRAPA